MAVNSVQLHELRHPDDEARTRYDGLIGIDTQKRELLEYVLRIFDRERLKRWQKKHHPKGLPLAKRVEERPPLVILSGDVGCGKTALATSVATPVADMLDKRVVALETPSDVRGGGLVGQLSERLTASFNEARTRLGHGPGILIIDEGDDLATSREQMQAHHEDRAGVNVLIKEIGRVSRDRIPLVIVLITNRLRALDPALVRRAQVIRFERPGVDARRALFEHLLAGIDHSPRDIGMLVEASRSDPPFTYSDLVERGAETALLAALRADQPFSASLLHEAVRKLEASPTIEGKKE